MEAPKSNGLKFIYLGLLAAALFSLGMCGVTLRRMIARSQPVSEGQPVRQGPVFPAFGNLTGHWQGNSLVPERKDICNLGLDLGEKNGEFAAYSTLVCAPTAASQMNSASSSLTILAGSADKLSVNFHVVKTVGAPKECPLTSLSLTPFGGVLAAEWRDGCNGGEIVLRRSGR